MLVISISIASNLQDSGEKRHPSRSRSHSVSDSEAKLKRLARVRKRRRGRGKSQGGRELCLFTRVPAGYRYPYNGARRADCVLLYMKSPPPPPPFLLTSRRAPGERERERDYDVGIVPSICDICRSYIHKARARAVQSVSLSRGRSTCAQHCPRTRLHTLRVPTNTRACPYCRSLSYRGQAERVAIVVVFPRGVRQREVWRVFVGREGRRGRGWQGGRQRGREIAARVNRKGAKEKTRKSIRGAGGGGEGQGGENGV